MSSQSSLNYGREIVSAWIVGSLDQIYRIDSKGNS